MIILVWTLCLDGELGGGLESRLLHRVHAQGDLHLHEGAEEEEGEEGGADQAQLPVVVQAQANSNYKT